MHMNNLSIFILKALRKTYAKVFNLQPLVKPESEQKPDKVSQIIYDALMDNKPCMIARFGSNELLCLSTYLGIKKNKRNIFTFISSKSETWWWNQENLDNMHYVAGFFPPTLNMFEQFCELLLEDIKEVDVLGSWLANEKYVEEYLNSDIKVDRGLMDPFFTSNPWTKALEGKKVLVVHPFNKSIQQQYINREHIFKNKDILPDFELYTIAAVQSLAGEKTNFGDWFEALDFMKSEIDKIEYDICLIGAGAYGFHLAAHVKRKGKKAVHIGGSLQLFFGIIGKRWEKKDYAEKYDYSALINEYWIRPNESEIPKFKNKVENGCYY